MRTPTAQDIGDALADIEDDSRYQSGFKKPAEIFSNAPLALIQVRLQALFDAYSWILGERERPR